MIETSAETTTSPAKDKAENASSSSIAYDPFNPDDSPDENDTPKEQQPIKFEIKGSALTKENKPGVLTESPLNKKDTNVDESCPNSVASSEVKVEKIDDKATAPEAIESDIKSEKCDQTNGTTTPKSEKKTSEDKPKSESTSSKTDKHHESNSSSSSHKDYKKDYKAENGSGSRKKHRSRSPHTDKKDSKTQSKSRSPRRSDKSSSKPSVSTTSSSRQRSRSSSKSKRTSSKLQEGN